VPAEDIRQRQTARYAVGAVSRALLLLGALAERRSITLAEAADVASVSKSTAYRLLATLEHADLAERIDEGGYRAGAGAVRWASQLLSQLDVRTVAEPTMRRLRDDTGETVNLALLRETSLVYVEILASPSPFRMADVPGASVPIHATALGKSIAVHLDPARLGQLLGPEPYPALTPATVTSWRELAAQLDEVRLRGFGSDVEEVATGVACVGAAVFGGGEAVGAISVSAPRARMDDERLERTGRQVAEAARQISERLAAQAPPRTRSATTPR
jgi:DNA-binding IclR family transcriptional regulator